jgi:phosphoribosylanthranilate isomerase
MTRIKICGITRMEDARAAAELGADAIGLVFFPGSPRCVDAAQANAIVAGLPPFVTTVALFVNADVNDVNRVLNTVSVDLLQFHGDESGDYCRQFKRPYMKAIRVRPGADLLQYASEHHTAKALLLDAYREEAYGGTGHTFDWKLIPANVPLPIVLSGGLNGQNVAEGIKALRPWAVDVSSGVESAKGIKDHAKMAEFISAVRHTDQEP